MYVEIRTDIAILFSQMQRFRGQVYLKDGAIKQSDLIDGRHVVEADDFSWHLLVHDENGTIAGCIRYQAHDTRSLFFVFQFSVLQLLHALNGDPP